MKFTYRFFKFPYKIYNEYNIEEIDKKEKQQEERTGILTPLPLDFVVGVKAVKIEDIIDYGEMLDKEHIGKELQGKLPHTVVLTSNGEFLCTWDRPKFEEELNKAYDRSLLI